LAERLGEGAHLRGIDDHHRQACADQARPATTIASKPPVASIATIFGDKAFSRTMRSSIPSPYA
jgi:hypothetical protein